MLKLKVEYHLQCPSCGTKLIVDYLGDTAGCDICPWCGVDYESTRVNDAELRDYIVSAIKNIEEHANCKQTAKC